MVHTSMLMTRPGPTDTTGIQSDLTILHNMCSYTLVDCRGLNLHCPHTSIWIQLSTIQMQNDSWCIVMHLSASMIYASTAGYLHVSCNSVSTLDNWQIQATILQRLLSCTSLDERPSSGVQDLKPDLHSGLFGNFLWYKKLITDIWFWRNLRQEISQLLIPSLFKFDNGFNSFQYSPKVAGGAKAPWSASEALSLTSHKWRGGINTQPLELQRSTNRMHCVVAHIDNEWEA